MTDIVFSIFPHNNPVRSARLGVNEAGPRPPWKLSWLTEDWNLSFPDPSLALQLHQAGFYQYSFPSGKNARQLSGLVAKRPGIVPGSQLFHKLSPVRACNMELITLAYFTARLCSTKMAAKCNAGSTC